MFILRGKLMLSLLSFIFICLIHTTTTLAQPDFLSDFCENAANYTVNSPYQRNLNTTLAALPTRDNGFGFYNLTTGDGDNDTVHSVALCRGDVNLDACQSCLNDSIVKLRQRCPNQKEAIGYYDNCLVKYSNDVILRSTRIKLYVGLANTQNATDINQFNDALGSLLLRLRGNASSGNELLKFASGNTNGPDFSTIYGLAQCTPDLSQQQCNDCLEEAINRIPNMMNGKVGGRILNLPMCNFRYEIYQFFNQTAQLAPPSPPPVLQPSPTVPPPPSPGKNNNTARTVVIIIVIVLVTIVILIASLCIFMRLRKKNRKTTPPATSEGVQTETMDMSTVESLQYDFNRVKAATNDFSEENKLGRGGFGTVYKERKKLTPSMWQRIIKRLRD